MENDVEALQAAILELVAKIPQLRRQDALEVLWAVAQLADDIEGGKVYREGRNGQLVR